MIDIHSDTYEVLGIIGSGGGGEVYKAYHKNLKKYVVLKRIRMEVQNFVNDRAEVDVLKNLKHPRLPQVYDFLNIEGNIYTVMDFIPGKSFKQWLDEGYRFEQRDVLVWMKQICETLDYLHTQDPPIIHSDLKPGNVMLMQDGGICLIDFNISATLDGKGSRVTGYTRGYASPEQIRAFLSNRNERNPSRWKTIDARADLYSLGAMVYHLLSGKKPAPAENGYVQDIRETGSDVKDVFAAVIMKCLEPNPDRRYQSADQLLWDLEHLSEKDKQFKALKLKQRLVYIAAVVSAFSFAGVAAAGYFRMDLEKQNEYEQLVELQKDCISRRDFDNFENYYAKAVDLDSGRLDAYYQKARALNELRRYDDSIAFINGTILSDDKLTAREEDLDTVYYILGDSYEQAGYYEKAPECYEKAIEIRPDSGAYYRDYAIALANNGQTEEAREALADARDRNLTTVEIDYVEGEILYNSGNYPDAKATFLACIDDSGDDYLKMRSYIMAGKCIDAQGKTIDHLEEKIRLLEQARQELDKEHNIGILEQLAQAYSDMGDAAGDTRYYYEAISVFEQIREQGMGSYDTDYNLAVLYQSTREYVRAEELLTQMLDTYGENYRTYKSFAFLEVAKQNDVIREQRNYSDFARYYKRTMELYQVQYSNNNANDVEIDRLTELYNQAVSNGWIAGE